MRFNARPRARGDEGHNKSTRQASQSARLIHGALIATAAFLVTAGLPFAQAGDSQDTVAPPEPVRINFQPEGSDLVCGYAPDYGEKYADRDGLSYGWNLDHTDATSERDTHSDQRLDTLGKFHAKGTWEVAVTNGEHAVRVAIGDPSHASTYTLKVEGTSFFEGAELDAGRFQEMTRSVTVTDGKLTLDAGAAPHETTSINFIEIDASGEDATTTEGCNEDGDPDDPSDPGDEDPRTAAPQTTSSRPVAGNEPPPSARVNFQPKGSPKTCSYVPDRGRVFAPRHDLAYGWNGDHMSLARDRGLRRDQRKDSLIHMRAGAVWEVALPPGEHRVKVSVGDAGYASTNTITVEGVSFFDDHALPPNKFASATHTVSVSDGRLTLDAGASPKKATRINFININVFEPRGCKDGAITGEGVDDSDSVDPLPARPYGLDGLRKVFGNKCNPSANDARAYFPSAGGRGTHGYVYFHSRLAEAIGHGVLSKINTKGKANDYGVWGYACRLMSGSTKWSVHSWGAAIDTNTLRNPYGQRFWNGRGSNGKRYRKFLPDIWMGRGFYWGLNFADPMHFQYVSGY